MTTIGIIGAGIAGLHLGLFLREHGVDATIYTERSADELRASRLANIVGRAAHTRERERLMGVDHWDGPEAVLTQMAFYVGGERPLAFRGTFDRPAGVVDMRIYCARLLEDFASRGGHVVIGAVHAKDVERLSGQHDLVVVATGRGKLATLFPRITEYSPYDRPQRVIFGGLYRGIATTEPRTMGVNVVPGHGEILILPAFSFEPGLTSIGVESIHGGALDVLRQLRYADDPRRHDAAVLKLLREHTPHVYDRIDPSSFGLTRPRDQLMTAITPAIRRNHTRLPNGRLIVGLGDAHVLMDPIIGQGANTASYAAWTLGAAICDDTTYDEAWCLDVEQRILGYARDVSDLSNARLQPPQPHVIELLVAATQHQPIADFYASGFNHPQRMWKLATSPERTSALLAEFGWQGMPVMAQAA